MDKLKTKQYLQYLRMYSNIPASLLEHDFFRVPRMGLRFFGIWPLDQGRLPFYFYVNFVTLLIAVVTETLEGFYHIDDIHRALDAFAPSLTQCVSWFKILIFWIYRSDFRHLLSRLYRLFRNGIYSYKRVRKIMKNFELIFCFCILSLYLLGMDLITERNPESIRVYKKEIFICHTATSLVFFFTGGTAVVYALRPIASNLYQYFAGKPIVRELPFRAIFPFDVYKNPLYTICYALLSHGGLCTITGETGVDGMFLTLCCHIAAQFDAISNEVKSLISEELGHQLTLVQNQDICKRLRNIIERQYDLFDIFEMILENYSTIILIHFVSAAMVLCFTSINLITVTGFDMLLYVFYSCAALSQLLLYSFGGTRIHQSSLNTANALYNMKWEHCNIRVRQMLILMIQRSQRGTCVLVPFFEVSLPAFTTILGTAGSYIALLKTFL